MPLVSDDFREEGSICGYWYNDNGVAPATGMEAFQQALMRLNRPVHVVATAAGPGVIDRGEVCLGGRAGEDRDSLPLLGTVPPLPPENFGDPGFKKLLGLRYAYVAGAMANGITSVEMVAAMAKAGMVGFFGAAGLAPDEVEKAVLELQNQLGEAPFGVNLIHSPGDPALEERIVDLYLHRKVRLISASAFMRLTPALVRYRVSGIYSDGEGRIVAPNRVVAKVSRVEVASRFFLPPPDKILDALAAEGKITAEEAALARRLPMADALTAEADSGGHTDNRPALSLLPTMLALRDKICQEQSYSRFIPVGLGGGIATPESAAAAFAMGAAYILTGSVNQSCLEAGVTDTVRRMLVEAGQADVTMAPAADMFEMGGKVQVLKRGTMFAMRAGKLHDLYVRHNCYEDLPEKERLNIEKNLLRRCFEDEWQETRRFFLERDPRQVERAEQDPRHKMALVFRSYLGRSSMWGITGEEDRKVDYQIWCGPAMGAFNEWARGSFLEGFENRDVVTVAMNLMFGAAVVTRAGRLRQQRVPLPAGTGGCRPMTTAEINECLQKR